MSSSLTEVLQPLCDDGCTLGLVLCSCPIRLLQTLRCFFGTLVLEKFVHIFNSNVENCNVVERVVDA